jgi:hypothetical protein
MFNALGRIHMRIGIVLMPIRIGINMEIRIGIKTMLIHKTADEQKNLKTANTKSDCLCCLFWGHEIGCHPGRKMSLINNGGGGGRGGI